MQYPSPEDVLTFEAEVLRWGATLGWRLERTGPLRRGVWPVARLEFLREGVLAPKRWDSSLAACTLFASWVAGRREACSVGGISVKFYQVEAAAWGFAQIAHTGPEEWVTFCRQQPGWDQLPAETEATAFARIGLTLLPPEQRDATRVSRLMAEVNSA